MKAACISLAILASVDAGKTTLTERILYECGEIRAMGRVDHGDTALDTHELERRRGITIFSKMARARIGSHQVILLDTPGHVDFSAECERTLPAADYALLLISAADGVTGHTQTLFRLLEKYELPVLIFVSKMDQERHDEETILKDIRDHLAQECVPYMRSEKESESFFEEAAMLSEESLEEYLSEGSLKTETVRRQILKRKLFPVFFGSAMKGDGIEHFLGSLDELLTEKEMPEEFGALCYKIAEDEKGKRLSFLRITGGSLRARSEVIFRRGDAAAGTDSEAEDPEGGEVTDAEKVTQIRLYSADKYTQAEEVTAGEICAVTGLSQVRIHDTAGSCPDFSKTVPEPVLTYALTWPEEIDRTVMYEKLTHLTEEIPEIRVSESGKDGLTVLVMGEVQTEILKSLVKDRFGIEIGYADAGVVYKETIQGSVIGVGHFEPLRHYAEVHLRIEEGRRGSGLSFDSECPTDLLARSWQQSILSSLRRSRLSGPLTGSELTDLHITLAAGKAHLKHTTGGDFRQAAVRALRQGLMKAQCVLLEPYYRFRIELPAANLGRAITDIELMHGRCDSPEIEGERAIIRGVAAVSAIGNYQMTLRAYTAGRGFIEFENGGFYPAADADSIVAASGYDPENDLKNPAWSVFCEGGSGVEVRWDEVEERAHLPVGGEKAESDPYTEALSRYRRHEATAQELEEIFEKTYGKIRKIPSFNREEDQPGRERKRGPVGLHRPRKKKEGESYLLVDGYNVIFDSRELRELAERDIQAARGKLEDLLSDYGGYIDEHVILVFDAYKVSGGEQRIYRHHNIHVVYTKEAETADRYIEKTVHRIGSSADITVATSDGAQQIIIFGEGARRMASRELIENMASIRDEHMKEYERSAPGGKFLLPERLSEETAQYLEQLRLGRQKDAEHDKR